MKRPIICLTIMLFSYATAYCQAVKDSSEVEGRNYKGYIMPLNTYHLSNSGKNKEKEFQPTKKDVYIAENRLASYLDSLCGKNASYIDRVDCEVIKKEFNMYFRQYRSYVSTKNGHRYMGISKN